MKVIRENDIIKVQSEYNKAFISGSRMIQGKWNSPYWVFPAENEEPLKELLVNVYGECGDLDTNIPRVTVDLMLDDYPHGSDVKIGDMNVCWRPARDSSVRLSDSAMLICGGFPKSGGSRNNPYVYAEQGTVLRVKGIPVVLFNKIKDLAGVKLVDESVDKRALAAEKERLLARIAEIDALIGA